MGAGAEEITLQRPTDVFSMLVIMALVSTFIATPLIRRLMNGQENRATPLGEAAAAGG